MSMVLLPFFGDVFKVLGVNVLLFWFIGWWFFSRKDAKEQRVILSVYEIVLPYQVQDIIFKIRCQWFYYLFSAMFLRCWVLMFYCFGLLVDDFFRAKTQRSKGLFCLYWFNSSMSLFRILINYQVFWHL